MGRKEVCRVMFETSKRTPYQHDQIVLRAIELFGPSMDRIVAFLAFIAESPENLNRPDGTLLARYRKWQRRKKRRGR